MKTFLSILFSFITISVSAQSKSDKVSITWSEEQEESRKDNLERIIGADENNFYAYMNMNTNPPVGPS
jgi:hypothetical protein